MSNTPVPELLYFIICDIPEQDFRLVDGVACCQYGGQAVALLQKVTRQLNSFCWYVQLMLHLQHNHGVCQMLHF